MKTIRIVTNLLSFSDIEDEMQFFDVKVKQVGSMSYELLVPEEQCLFALGRYIGKLEQFFCQEKPDKDND